MKIKNGDTVRVISGRDRGQTGKVISVNHAADTILVEGVNKVFRHVRPSQKNPQGGRLHKEMPIRACKAMVVCPKTNKPTRIGYKFRDDGSKVRIARCSNEVLNEVAPPKASYAKG